MGFHLVENHFEIFWVPLSALPRGEWTPGYTVGLRNTPPQVPGPLLFISSFYWHWVVVSHAELQTEQ